MSPSTKRASSFSRHYAIFSLPGNKFGSIPSGATDLILIVLLEKILQDALSATFSELAFRLDSAALDKWWTIPMENLSGMAGQQMMGGRDLF